MKINIANIIIDLVFEHKYNINTPYFQLIMERFGAPDFLGTADFTFKLVPFTQKPSKQYLMEYRNNAFYRETEDMFMFETDTWISSIDWKNKVMSTMFYNKSYSSIEDRLCMASLKLLLSFLVIQRKGLPFHCSALCSPPKKNGIIFSGQSTAGKTLLARLMKNTKKWIVFNDECNIILPNNESYYMYATPFTSPDKLTECTNGHEQIQKIFFLKHGNTVYTKRMTLSQKYFSVLQGTFTYPTSEHFSNLMMKTGERIARTIPIEMLHFNPQLAISYPDKIQQLTQQIQEN